MPDVVYDTPPNDPSMPLPNGAFEPVSFTCTRPLEFLIVDMGGAAEECAFRDGDFVSPYEASSTISEDGLSVSVIRNGGWLAPPLLRPRIEPVPSAVPAALVPAGKFGALAQWSLLRSGGVLDGSDRSGNGYTMGFTNPTGVPDLIPGRTCFLPGFQGQSRFQRAATPALRLTGAVTVALRCAASGYKLASDAGYLYSYANFPDGSENGACLYSLIIDRDSGRPVYFCQNGAGKTAVIFHAAGLPPVNDGLWHYVSMRRNVAGTVVTLGVDGIYQTSGTLLPPTGGSSSFPCIGSNTLASPSELFHGPMADVNIFGASLSDAQDAELCTIMLGSS